MSARRKLHLENIIECMKTESSMGMKLFEWQGADVTI
jgi:hypothetical protein